MQKRNSCTKTHCSIFVSLFPYEKNGTEVKTTTLFRFVPLSIMKKKNNRKIVQKTHCSLFVPLFLVKKNGTVVQKTEQWYENTEQWYKNTLFHFFVPLWKNGTVVQKRNSSAKWNSGTKTHCFRFVPLDEMA